MAQATQQFGKLAAQDGYQLPIQVLRSAAGFYIGTRDEIEPVSRESEEYWKTKPEAEKALTDGTWTQRADPLTHSGTMVTSTSL